MATRAFERTQLRPQIADHRIGATHISAQHGHQRLIDDALAKKLQRWDLHAFLVNVAKVVAAGAPADIRRVRRRRRIPDEGTAVVERLDEIDVGQMARAVPGIIGDQDVAGRQRGGREVRRQPLHRARKRADERRYRVLRLRQKLAARVGDHAGVVVRLAHDGGERGPDQCHRRLVHGRHQALPQDLQRDGVEGVRPLHGLSLKAIARSSVSLHRHDDVAVGLYPSLAAGRQQQRQFRLLDQRRPRHLDADAEQSAVVHVGRHKAAEGTEVGWA